MKKAAVMTDSNCGITQAESRDIGVTVVPMPFEIDGAEYFEGINLTQEQFYEKLAGGAEVSTSQPNPGTLTDTWDKLLKENDELVYIPMSSGLSGSCGTARMLAEDYDGKVCVVNNQRISVTQRQSVYDAIHLAEAGHDAAQIQEILEKDKFNSSIYIMVDTLKYLKKGGRITPAAAALGSLLRIKPVLTIQGEKVDAFKRARTVRVARTIMLQAIRKDMQEHFDHPVTEEEVTINVAYTPGEYVQEWIQDVKKEFPNTKTEIYVQPLPLSISCHLGPGALAVTVTKNLKID